MDDPTDSPTEPELVRKLATIVSADVAGFSRLMADDEERTLRIFRSYSEMIATLVTRHRGRIFNTAGDAILAEFASPVEAVRAATEIQSALHTLNDPLPAAQRVQFRIGVNLGDVMVQGNDLLGDGVNVASRLQTTAEPGGICISAGVHEQIRNKLSLNFTALGERSFKNIPEPVRAYAISSDAQVPMSRRWVWRAAAVLAVLLMGAGGYWALSRGSATQGVTIPRLSPPAGDNATRPAAPAKPPGIDGIYAGPVCYGDAPNAKAFCFRAEGTVSGGEISGKWTFANGFATVMTGTVTADGKVQIELQGRDSDGKPAGSSRLSGMVQDGRLQANGNSPAGREASIDWRHN